MFSAGWLFAMKQEVVAIHQYPSPRTALCLIIVPMHGHVDRRPATTPCPSLLAALIIKIIFVLNNYIFGLGMIEKSQKCAHRSDLAKIAIVGGNIFLI